MTVQDRGTEHINVASSSLRYRRQWGRDWGPRALWCRGGGEGFAVQQPGFGLGSDAFWPRALGK